MAAWHLLGAGPRQAFRDDLGSSDLDWARGQAWAFEQAMGLVWYYAETNPVMSRLGRVTLDRIQSAGRPLLRHPRGLIRCRTSGYDYAVGPGGS